MRIGAFVLSLAFAATFLAAAEFPSAEISNGQLQLKLYLPDPERGYYRGTRFDWSGVISSLKHSGHEYVGQWFEKYDPKLHDAITGPVEEFRTNDAGLGYTEAAPGGIFVRIGVGAVRKPEESAYLFTRTYDIVDPGKWKVRHGKDWIEFVHELKDAAGYGYRYQKTIRLVKDKPQMSIEHLLRNTGKRPIQTSQYNHNFFVIDGRPTGPEFTVRFPFEVKATMDLKGIAEVGGRELRYRRELVKGESVFTGLEGFGASASDYDLRIENSVAKAGVQISGDRPFEKLVFWCIRTTLCPEPYIALSVEPGAETRWTLSYRFYNLPETAAR